MKSNQKNGWYLQVSHSQHHPPKPLAVRVSTYKSVAPSEFLSHLKNTMKIPWVFGWKAMDFPICSFAPIKFQGNHEIITIFLGKLNIYKSYSILWRTKPMSEDQAAWIQVNGWLCVESNEPFIFWAYLNIWTLTKYAYNIYTVYYIVYLQYIEKQQWPKKS